MPEIIGRFDFAFKHHVTRLDALTTVALKSIMIELPELLLAVAIRA